MVNILREIVLVALLLQIHIAVGSDDIEVHWQQFKQKNNKFYSGVIEQKRRQQWADNMKYIAQHNLEAAQGKHTYTLGENQYADMNLDEFKQLLLRGNPVTRKPRAKRQYTYCESAPASNLSSYVNWTAEGWVTPVKNQGDCGACWAFSAVGALEALHYNRTGVLVSLSEQNLIDCSWSEGNQGCDGGFVDKAYIYVQENGIQLDSDYPYVMHDNTKDDPAYGECVYNASNSVLKILDYQEIDSYNELALQQAVALIGPVSVGINANSRSFMFYEDGVYNKPYCRGESYYLNHAVLVVGYGTFETSDYWLIKNSWGTDWGIDGYMMLARNANNMCGIATEASFPIDNSSSLVYPCDAESPTPTPSPTPVPDRAAQIFLQFDYSVIIVSTLLYMNWNE